jgi:hypothetical protein
VDGAGGEPAAAPVSAITRHDVIDRQYIAAPAAKAPLSDWMGLMGLSKFATAALVSVALTFTSTAASAAACQAGPGACVFPVTEAVPPPVQNEAAATQSASGGGLGLLPIVAIAIAALAAILVLLDDDGDDEPVSP